MVSTYEKYLAELQRCGSDMPIEQWWDRWIELESLEEQSTRRIYRATRRLLEGTLFGRGLTVASVTPAHIAAWLRCVCEARSITGAPYAYHTVLARYRAIRSCFRAAVRAGIIIHSPCDSPIVRDELPAARCTSAYEAQRPHSARTIKEYTQIVTSSLVSEWWRTMISIAALTGARVSEIAELRRSDIDISTRPLWSLTISRSWSRENLCVVPTKTGDTRVVPVHPALHAVLRAWMNGGYRRYTGEELTPNAILLPRKSNLPGRHLVHMGANRIALAHHRLCRRCSIRPLRLHDWRATFISWLREAGADIRTAQRWTHRSRDIYGGYVRPSWAAQCREIKKINIPDIGIRSRCIDTDGMPQQWSEALNSAEI